jgi:hypothetical protein
MLFIAAQIGSSAMVATANYMSGQSEVAVVGLRKKTFMAAGKKALVVEKSTSGHCWEMPASCYAMRS